MYATGSSTLPLTKVIRTSKPIYLIRSMIFVPASRCQPLLPVPKQVFPRCRINAKASAGTSDSDVEIVSSAYVDGRSRTFSTISGLTATLPLVGPYLTSTRRSHYFDSFYAIMKGRDSIPMQLILLELT